MVCIETLPDGRYVDSVSISSTLAKAVEDYISPAAHLLMILTREIAAE